MVKKMGEDLNRKEKQIITNVGCLIDDNIASVLNIFACNNIKIENQIKIVK